MWNTICSNAVEILIRWKTNKKHIRYIAIHTHNPLYFNSLQAQLYTLSHLLSITNTCTHIPSLSLTWNDLSTISTNYTLKASVLVTALVEKSLNIAYFPGELNISTMRRYFISGAAYDHNIGEIMRETCHPLLHYIFQKTQTSKEINSVM